MNGYHSILCARGTVVRAVKSGKIGAYRIKEFPADFSQGDYPILIQSIQVEDNDIVLPVACIGNSKVVYSFGSDFGNVGVGGIILLGPLWGGEGTSQIDPLLAWFNTYRVSNSGKPISGSIAQGRAFRFMLTRLTIAAPDTEFHIQPFALSGLLVSPS